MSASTTLLPACAGLPEPIVQMVARLVELFQPRKIILFGSWARGMATPDSDVDLMVVMDRVSNRRQQRIAMRRALDGMDMPKDIILVSIDEFAQQRQVPGSVVYPAASEGITLYAALPLPCRLPASPHRPR